MRQQDKLYVTTAGSISPGQAQLDRRSQHLTTEPRRFYAINRPKRPPSIGVQNKLSMSLFV
jgi:hypothetical protein